MDIRELMTSAFAGPAVLLNFKEDQLSIEDVNERFLEEIEVNISIEEFLSRNLSDLFDQDSQILVYKAVKKCIEDGAPVSTELKCSQILSCCGNDAVYLRAKFANAGEENGKWLIYVSIRNITGEKTKIDTLAESERRFKIASEQINIYYWEYTVATKEMRPCFRCMRDLGLPALVVNYPEPAIEAGIFPPDYADMYRDWHRQIAQGVKELEAVIPLTVGRVPFRVKYTTEFDENGNPYKAYGSATLVSEEELKNNALSKSIIETLANSYDLIALMDYEQKTMTLIKDSPAVGLEDVNDLGASISKFLAQFDLDENIDIAALSDIDYLKKDFFNGTDKREFDLRQKDTGAWIHVVSSVIERNDTIVSKALLSAGVMDDAATKNKEAQITIRQQKQILEEQQSQLKEAVEEANRANRAKSDFLARMSHEIRTPMNAIMGMNEIIIKAASEPSIRGYAADAYKAATGLLGTINEILDFSKIESGKMEILESDFDLSEFAGNLYTMFALRAESKNLALVFDIDQSIPLKVRGDENHLLHVISNLLSNAVKYTKEGKVTFRMKELSRNSGKTKLFFEVADSGMGIRKEDIPRLFEVFERIDIKENRKIEGSGLGMNIVAGLLNLMGAKLNVESEYGKGSSFSFEMELDILDEKPLGDFKKILDQKETKKEERIFTAPGREILVVDDNAINLRVISALLKATQVKVTTASSGQEALNLTLNNKYDLIFLDHYMPEMDGIETMQHLKEQTDGKNTDTPVIALTANAIKGAEDEYLSQGFVEAVFKPTTQKILSDTLEKYL